jgi:hypothetical protein
MVAPSNTYNVRIKLPDGSEKESLDVTLLGPTKNRGDVLEPEDVYRIGVPAVEGAQWVVEDARVAPAPQAEVHYLIVVGLVYDDSAPSVEAGVAPTSRLEAPE